ncbi:hypothetical protein [Roseibium sp.]|uniref:hypothetical protein n=1 Tax=Roseibium sp. TaxID=1936156 RepID=UPI003B50BB50
MLYKALICNVLIVTAMAAAIHLKLYYAIDTVLYVSLNIALSVCYGILAVAVIRHRKEIEAQAMMMLMVVYNSTAVLKICQLIMLY